MRDHLHALLNWLDHDRYLAAALILSAIVIAGVTACQPRAQSRYSGKQVTAAELEAERQAYQAGVEAEAAAAATDYDTAVKALNVSYEQQRQALAAKHQIAMTDLTAQAKAMAVWHDVAAAEIEREQMALTQALGTLTQLSAQLPGGWGDLLGAGIGLAGVLIGGGALLDNRRKDQVITTLKQPPAAPAPAVGAGTGPSAAL